MSDIEDNANSTRADTAIAGVIGEVQREAFKFLRGKPPKQDNPFQQWKRQLNQPNAAEAGKE